MGRAIDRLRQVPGRDVAEQFFDDQLRGLGLTLDQIASQSLQELEETLAAADEAIANPAGFATISVKVAISGAVIVATAQTDAQFTWTILPFLLERKRVVLARIKELGGSAEVAKLSRSAAGPGSRTLVDGGPLPHPVAIGATVSATLLGIVAGILGALPWWISIGIVVGSATFAPAAWKLHRLPFRLPELAALLAVGAVVALAAHGVGGFFRTSPRELAFRVAAPYGVIAHFEPLVEATTGATYSLGDEVQVQRRYVDSPRRLWYSVAGQIQGINDPWLPAADLVPNLPEGQGRPRSAESLGLAHRGRVPPKIHQLRALAV